MKKSNNVLYDKVWEPIETLVIAGYSQQEIASSLNQASIPSLDGKAWDGQRVGVALSKLGLIQTRRLQ